VGKHQLHKLLGGEAKIQPVWQNVPYVVVGVLHMGLLLGLLGVAIEDAASCLPLPVLLKQAGGRFFPLWLCAPPL